MTRTRVRFSCTECGAQAPKWLGRCPECGGWDTLDEEPVPGARAAATPVGPPTGRCRSAMSTPASRPRRPPGIEELDRVLGGGLVGGSVTLLGGEPGSARARSCSRRWRAWRRPARRCCSSPPRSRRSRCGCGPSGSARSTPSLLIVAETSLPHVLTHVAERRTRRARGRLDPDGRRSRGARRARFGEPGARVRAPARARRQGSQHPDGARRTRHQGRRDRRAAHARAHRGHGARVRGRPSSRAAHAARAKHRFGSTARARPVRDGGGRASSTSRTRRASSSPTAATGLPGSVVTAVLEGARPVLVEVQALVTPTPSADAAAFVAGSRPEPAHAAARGPRRARGAAGSRTPTSTRASPAASGSPRPAPTSRSRSPSPRARRGRPVAADLVAVGEIGLGGEVRQAAADAAPARRSGAARVQVTRSCPPRWPTPPDLDLIRVGTVHEALRAAGLGDETRQAPDASRRSPLALLS